MEAEQNVFEVERNGDWSWEFLKAVSERTTYCAPILSKKFATEIAQGVKRIFAGFMYVAAKFCRGFKTPLSDSTWEHSVESQTVLQ